MRKFLTFRLFGPMASWGDIAVGETRPTFVHPSKSAIIGLLGAALGVDRDEDDTHRALQNAYGFAVLVESAGTPLRDYHTTQTAGQAALKRQGGAYTRKEELEADKLGTILSTRDYRCDALYMVFIWEDGPQPPFSLQEMAEALDNPKFHVYLGRKSCPPALPMQPRVIEAQNLAQAVKAGDSQSDDWLAGLPKKEPRGLYWEGDQDEGLSPRMSVERRDAVHSRQRWQFLVREEHFSPMDEQE